MVVWRPETIDARSIPAIREKVTMSRFESQKVNRTFAAVRGADNFLFTGLCFLVIVIAVPFGGVDLWARMLFATGMGVLVFAWAVVHFFSSRPLPVGISKIVWPASLFLCVCLWIALQTTPFVPINWQHPIWLQASQILDQDIPGSISINPETTLQGLISLVSAAAVFWLALQLGRSPERAGFGIRLFVVSSVFFALYGILNFLGDGSNILWMEKRFYPESVTSTFINRNSYATYAGLGLICSVALLIDRSVEPFRSGNTAFQGFVKVLEGFFTRNAIYLIATVLLFTALLLTQSRAGNASVLIGLCALLAATARAGIVRLRQTFIAVLMLAPVVGVIVSVSGSGLGARMPTVQSFDLDGRGALYAVTMDAIKDRPFLGSGFGTYREAIYPYLNDQLLTDRSWFDAHNTYLEKTLELGVPIAFALFSTILLLALSCWRGLRRRRRNQVFPAIAVGASCMIATHSLLDFSVEIPAVTVSFVFLLGIGVAQSLPSSRSKSW